VCAHIESIEFDLDERKLVARICPHCFDISENGATRYYAMRPELYAEFRRLFGPIWPERPR